jgi:Zn-finger protein
MDSKQQGQWLTSKEAKKRLKISDCELMHRRESGKLIFKKVGRAFYYFIEDEKVEQK